MRSSTPPPPSLLCSSTGSLELRFPKRFVNIFAVDEVNDILSRLASFDPLPFAAEYGKKVIVSPLYVTIPVADDSSESRPLGFVPLPRGLGEVKTKVIAKKIIHVLYGLRKRKVVVGTLSLQNFSWNPETGDVFLERHIFPPTFFTKNSPLAAELTKLCAPEIIAGQQYGPASDVWSIGVMLVFLLTTNNRGGELETEDLVDTNVMSPVINHLTPSAVSLICQCLKSDASVRPTLMDLLMHPFFREGLDDVLIEEGGSEDNDDDGAPDDEDDDESGSEDLDD